MFYKKCFVYLNSLNWFILIFFSCLSTFCSDRLHEFGVIIPMYHMYVYGKGFFLVQLDFGYLCLFFVLPNIRATFAIKKNLGRPKFAVDNREFYGTY